MLIKIKNLHLKTILGIHTWEENTDREIIINVEIETNHLASLTSDNIEDTIDYDEIIFKIKDLVKSQRFKLVEKLTAKIIKRILEDKRIIRCKLEVDKVGVPGADSFSVTLEQYGR